MNKDYNDAYQRGKDEAERTGENNLAFDQAKQLLRPSSWLPGAENRLKQASEGYQQGFKDGIRRPKVEIINPLAPATTNPNPSTTMTSISGQISLLENLRDFLSHLQVSLNTAAVGYQRRVDELHAQGLFDEYHRDLSNESLAATLQEVNQLIANIEARDKPQVQEIIGHLLSYRP